MVNFYPPYVSCAQTANLIQVAGSDTYDSG